MAYTIAQTSIISVIYRSLADGQENLLTLHYRLQPDEGVMDDPDGEEVLGQISTQLSSPLSVDEDYTSVLSSDIAKTTRIQQVIYPQRFVKVVYALDFDGVGTAPAPMMPPNAAHVITLRGDIATPHARGNKHIGGVPKEWTEDGFATGAALAAYATLADQLKGSFSITTAVGNFNVYPVIYNRANPTISIAVTNYTLGETTRVERRRTVGLGS